VIEKIDVHPFATRRPGTGYCMCNELPANRLGASGAPPPIALRLGILMSR